MPRRNKYSQPKFSATQVFSSKEFSNGLLDERNNTEDSRINEQSGELEQDNTELEQDNTELSQGSAEGDAEEIGDQIGFKYFKKNKKIKDFTKRETM